MMPAFINAVQMPRPWSRLIANGPIGPDDVQTWLQAGATAVGTMASVPAEALAAKDYGQVTAAVQALNAARDGATDAR